MMPEPAMKDPKNYLTGEQVGMVIDSIPNLRDKLLFKLLWATGARVSEILNIRLEMIDFDGEMIVIKALKKKEEQWRSIYIDTDTANLIRLYLQNRGFKSDYLFSADGDKPLTRQMGYLIVRQACERVGITKVGDRKVSKRGLKPHPHTLRHSFAMDWFKKGGSAERLQKILGHVNYGTTISYLRFSDKDLKEEYDRIKAGR